MQKILGKRVFRDLKKNRLRYFALGLMIALCIFIINALIGAAVTITEGSNEFQERSHVEDGQFTVFVPLTETEISELEDMGAQLEEHFSLMHQLSDGSELRVMKVRERIDTADYISGGEPANDNEAAIERRYAEVHEISVGDEIEIGNVTYSVSGICVTADYDAPYKELTDTAVDSKSFGTAFLTDSAYESLKEKAAYEKAEEYLYAYRLSGTLTDDDVKDYLQTLEIDAEDIDDEYFEEYWERTGGRLDDLKTLLKGLTRLTKILAPAISEMLSEANEFFDEYADISLTKLESFLTSADNNRIGAAKGDVEINMYAGYAAGVIVMILFSYVISVFVVHGIEQESSVIGALYALGVKRKNLLLHYITLPVAVTLIGGIIGTLLGGSEFGAKWRMADTATYFSIPDFDVHVSAVMLVYGVVMPPAVAAAVNLIVIKKKLSCTALSLMRNEQKASKISGVQIKGKSFLTTFRIRQMIRESRSAMAVVAGMFVSMLILMLGLDCLRICQYVKDEATADVSFEYMYAYKYPTEEVPEGGEAAYAYTMKKEVLGYKFDVTLMGVEKNTAYFDLPEMSGKNSVVLSSAAATKYGLAKGDILVLNDEEEKKLYAFEIAEIVDYDTSFYAFMNIDDLRELMGQSDDYYNVVFSDRELDIPAGRLYATTSREMIEKASVIFLDVMKSMIVLLLGVSVVVFILVMYLMMKVMIDRSAANIALIKIFGYRKKEIRKLYLDGNLYVIALGALVCIPLSKAIMDAVFPNMVANCNCGLNFSFPLWAYVALYAAVILLYFVINHLLVSRINKIVPAEVLKNRE